MSEDTIVLQVTDFCKKARRIYEIWSAAVGSNLTSTDEQKTILKVIKSNSGDVEGLSVGTPSQNEIITINNIQTRFRSITITKRLNLQIFKPKQFQEIIREEELKRKNDEQKLQEREKQQKKEEVYIKKLNNHLIQDFLSSESYYNKHLSENLSLQSYKKFRARFVKAWIEKKAKGIVDFQQALAISSVDRNTIVTARAGSGKTATLVNRIIFLNKHCDVNPEEFLVLAFNRNAAAEIRERLTLATGKDFKNVMTFHSLAYSIARPTEAILYDNPKEEQFNQSSIVQSLIDFHLKDSEWNQCIKTVMMSYFKQDWDEIASKGFNLSTSEMIEFRRNSPKIGLDGWYYKSYGEKKIADVLFEYGMHNEYEHNFWWNGINYKPDFIVQRDDKYVVIEYFGLKGQPDYDAQIKEKQAYWKRDPKWTLLEIYPHHISGIDLETFLIDALAKHGLVARKLSDDEIWEKIQHRAVDQFSRLSSGFINRVRQKSYTPNDLETLISEHEIAFPHEDDFLSVMSSIFSGYTQRIRDTGEDDFSGLMMQAIEKMEDGVCEFRKRNYVGNLKSLKFIMIDEFQDFTELFYKCVIEIQRFNQKVNIFCVGDDWQAINGFAGSDLQYFMSFTDYFGTNNALKIQTNYRSTAKIVNAGNHLMQGQGALAKAHTDELGTIELVDLSIFEPSDSELHKFENQVFTPAILRLIRKLVKDGKTVTLLARNNSIPWYVGKIKKDLDSFAIYLKKFLTDREIQHIKFSTIHSFKGQQSDAVILLDFKQQRYPFVHPNNFFTRIFGDTVSSILMDEQRLLYVGLTRAKNQLFLVTEKKDLPFEFKSFSSITSHLNWENYPEVSIGEEDTNIKIVSIVGKTFPLKGILKSSGYKWTPRKQKDSGSWSKRVDFNENNFAEYFSEISVLEGADDIQILIHNEGGKLEKKLQIRNGRVF